MEGESLTAAPLVRYRNRDVGEREVQEVRELIAEHAQRRKIALALCRKWDWRQKDGRWAFGAAHDFLLRMAEWGHIALPAKVAAKGRPRRELPQLPLDFVPLKFFEIESPHFDLASLEVRPIAEEERLGWRLHVQRLHYLGYRPPVGKYLLYAAFLEGALVALLSWASAAFRAPLREKFIGWNESLKGQHLHLIANNTRFLVLPWVRVKNLASKVLAQNLRRLSADWKAKWGHPLYLAETFVDTRRFRGSCYKASNWKYLGETAGRTKSGNLYLYEGHPKALYVFELHRHARQLLREGEQKGAR